MLKPYLIMNNRKRMLNIFNPLNIKAKILSKLKIIIRGDKIIKRFV